jgi:hypothetical protein
MMNRKSLHQIFIGAVTLSLLAGCSSGDVNISSPTQPFGSWPSAPGSGPVVTQGIVTRLDSITVNDVRYATSNATIETNGQAGSLADLRRGQVVTIHGRIDADGWSGTANDIRFDANIIGPVASLDADRHRMMVMGQVVITDANTLFGGGVDATTFAGLAIDEIIQVSGFVDAARNIRATRIDPVGSTATLHVVGEVSGLDLANFTFAVNGLSIDYGNAAMIDLPGGAPANGMTVKSVGSMRGGFFVANRLVSLPALNGNSGRRVQIAGIVTRFVSRTDFDINDLAATTHYGTLFSKGLGNDLALNAEITIDGEFTSGGRIRANWITFGL